jgi:phage tail sheath gpL-like
VTADNVSGVVTFTANCGGTITNGITLNCYFDSPVNLVGTSITLSGSNFTGGSGVVDITNTLAATTGHRYHVIAILLDDSASGGLAKSHTDSEGDAEHNHGEIYIQCCNGTLSANTTIALAQNANRGVLASINGSPSWTVQIAAAMAAVDSREEVATRPRNGTVLTGIVPPPVSYRWSRTETRNLLDNGCSPLVVLPGEQVAILREVTTGVTNGNGDFDYSTLDVTKILGFDRFRDAITLMMDTNYQKARWADSDPDGLLPTDVATPEKVTIDLIDVARDMEAEGIVSNVETLKDQFVVEKHGTQCWFSVPALIVDGMHEKLGKVVYITKLPLGS